MFLEGSHSQPMVHSVAIRTEALKNLYLHTFEPQTVANACMQHHNPMVQALSRWPAWLL